MNIVFFLISLPMLAQVSINGTYDSANKVFNTDDKTFWISFFKNRVAKISNNGLMGLMNTSGKILCIPKYDIIYDFEDGMAVVGLNGKYGLIKIDGEELTIPQFEVIEKVNQNLFIVKTDNKYCIMKNDGSFLSEIKYDHLQVTRDKDIVFYRGNDIGLIDLNTGTELPVFKYKKEYFINDTGLEVFQYIRFVYKYRTNAVLEFNEGLTITYKYEDNTMLFGFMDENFKTIIEPQYEWVEPFKNKYSIIMKNEKCGVIDKAGKLTLPIEFESIQILDNQKFLVFKDGKYGVLDNNGNTAIPLIYDSLFYIENNLYAVYNGEKWGVINENEKLILNYEYDGITSGLAVKFENKDSYATSVPRSTLYFKGYFFDEKGLLEKENIRISKYVEGLYDFSKNPKTFIPYLIECNNNENKTRKYDYEEVVTNQFKIVGIKKKGPKLNLAIYNDKLPQYSKGITNYKGEVIIPLIYDDIIQQNGCNIFIVKKDGKYGVINIENKIIVNPEYDGIKIIGGVIIVQKVSNSSFKRAIIDFTGKMIISFKDNKYREGNAGALITDGNIIDKRKL